MKKKPLQKKQLPLYRRKPSRRKGAVPSLEVPERGAYVLRDEPASPVRRPLRCVELFAGAGGLALAASNAGFEHDAVLEYNHDACETIRANQRRGYELVRHWPLIEADVHHQDFSTWRGHADNQLAAYAV